MDFLTIPHCPVSSEVCVVCLNMVCKVPGYLSRLHTVSYLVRASSLLDTFNCWVCICYATNAKGRTFESKIRGNNFFQRFPTESWTFFEPVVCS